MCPMISHIYPWANTIVLGGTDGVAGPASCRTFVGERWGKQVELFLSTYANKVDRKGRVSVPATFRSALATHREPNLVVALPSLQTAGSRRHRRQPVEEMNERLDTLEQFSDEHENLTQSFADSHPMTIDPEGRIVLPEQLTEHAGIGSRRGLCRPRARCSTCGSPRVMPSIARRSENARAARA